MLSNYKMEWHEEFITKDRHSMDSCAGYHRNLPGKAGQKWRKRWQGASAERGSTGWIRVHFIPQFLVIEVTEYTDPAFAGFFLSIPSGLPVLDSFAIAEVHFTAILKHISTLPHFHTAICPGSRTFAPRENPGQGLIPSSFQSPNNAPGQIH